jgi:hypothetical protein
MKAAMLSILKKHKLSMLFNPAAAATAATSAAAAYPYH